MIRRLEPQIRPEGARHRLAALDERVAQRAAHETEPVAIGGDLVVRIDGRDRILEVHDCGQRRFQHDVADSGGVGASDRMRAVEAQDDVQVVMAQQDLGRRRCGGGVEAGECRTLDEADAVVGETNSDCLAVNIIAECVRMRADAERCDLVE